MQDPVEFSASVAQTSVFEVCGSSADLRFRIQGQTGNRQPGAAHGLRRTHAGILVHATPRGAQSGALRQPAGIPGSSPPAGEIRASLAEGIIRYTHILRRGES